MKAFKFLSLFSAFCIISSALVFAKTYDSDFGEEIKKDRQRLFYRICMDAYKDIEKRGASLLCPAYARRVVGEDFRTIFDSMQLEFKDVARRNSHLPRVILTEKKTQKEFLSLLQDKDPKYIDIFFPGYSDTVASSPTSTTRRVPRIIDVNVIDLSEGDMNTGTSYVADQRQDHSNIENKPSLNSQPSQNEDESRVAVELNLPTPTIVQKPREPAAVDDKPLVVIPKPVVPVTVNVEDKPSANVYSDEEIRRIYNESLEFGLTKYCVNILRQKKDEVTSKDVLYCDKFAKSLKDKNIDEVILAFKNDPVVKADISEAVVKKLIVTVAVREGHDEKQITDFVYSGGHVKLTDATVVDATQTPNIPAPEPTRGPAVVDVSSNEVEQNLRDAYSEILTSEVAKNCSISDKKCIEDTTRQVNEQRDAALSNLNPTPAQVFAQPDAPALVSIPVVSAFNEVNCEDQIQNKIRELLEKDESNILGKQFQLTSLKMALQIMETRSQKRLDNMEDYIQADQKKLLAKDNKQVLGDLVSFYRDHGKVEDENFIDKTFSKVANSNYFRSSTRIYNDSASVMILADSLTNENSRFNEVDAASAWFASEINKNFKQGSYHNNLTNLSSLTFRVLGKLKNEKPPIDINKLKSNISAIENDLSGNYEIMRKEIGERFANCFQGELASCNAKPAFDKNFARSLMDLTSKIKNSDSYSLEIDRSLKGEINGQFKFDFLPGQYK